MSSTLFLKASVTTFIKKLNALYNWSWGLISNFMGKTCINKKTLLTETIKRIIFSGLRDHGKLHIPVESPCTVCEEVLSCEWDLREHLKLFHRKHSCFLFWSIFLPDERSYYRIGKIHHLICTKIWLSRRIKAVFTEEEKLHVCEACGSKFANRSSLNNHIKLLHEKWVKNYQHR